MSPTFKVATDRRTVPFETLSRHPPHHDINVAIWWCSDHRLRQDPHTVEVARILLRFGPLETTMTRILLLTTAWISLLAACEPEVDCTTEARGSVNVSVVDADGAPTDAFDSISYDSSTFSDDCEGWETGEYVCGWEVAGDITITVEACGGSQTISETVTVQSDECHVIPEALELQIDPCDAPAR